MIARFLNRARKLNDTVLGINARNLACIYPLNPRCHFPRADDKLLCKKFLNEHGIAHPKTLAAYDQYRDLLRLEKDIEDLNSFAVKPKHGCQGRGILVVTRDADGVLTINRRKIDAEELRTHIYRILTGCFSLGKVSDSAFLEQCVIADDTFQELLFTGLPDIRLILCRDVPVMAMARVPTAESGGLANLHQGALGLGIDLETGMSTQGVHKNRCVTQDPETQKPLAGHQVPHWGEILEMAIRSSRIFGLGYIGVDIVIDRHEGPMVMEVNARPGLNVQLANAVGLKIRIPWETVQ